MTQFRSLYIDMNAFFASVEQQVDPSLRGKPVAITAVETESGCVVAASYEAKAFGVKTGTRVYEARQLCPAIIFRPSRHRLYVRFNQRIASVLDRHAELEHIRSVDEFQIALGGSTSDLAGATALTKRLKQLVRNEIGTQLRFSAGIGPNQLLAKIAGKLEKPDGLQWLSPVNMPDALAHLDLSDLPGISKNMRARLWKAQVWDIASLHALDPRHARKIWRSVEGERFVRALQGENIPLLETKRGGYGNSKVLAPKYRSPEMARLVARWLIEKSTERMRRDGFCAGRFSMHARFERGGGHSDAITCNATQDTAQFLRMFDRLWARIIPKHACQSIGVQLAKLVPLEQRSGELFLPLSAGQQSGKERLSSVIDKINKRYGPQTVRFGVQQDHPGFFDRG